MALIKCPECGKMISDKALTCPQCGAPIALAMPIPVTFVRPKSFLNSAISCNVFVDGQKIGILTNGWSFQTTMYTGKHIVELVYGPRRTTNEIYIDDDAHEAVVHTNNGGTFGFKIVSVQCW